MNRDEVTEPGQYTYKHPLCEEPILVTVGKDKHGLFVRFSKDYYPLSMVDVPRAAVFERVNK